MRGANSERNEGETSSFQKGFTKFYIFLISRPESYGHLTFCSRLYSYFISVIKSDKPWKWEGLIQRETKEKQTAFPAWQRLVLEVPWDQSIPKKTCMQLESRFLWNTSKGYKWKDLTLILTREQAHGNRRLLTKVTIDVINTDLDCFWNIPQKK